MRGWSAFVVAALTVLSASAQQLNPTVKVLAKPQTSVPPECEEGLAPAVPRAIIAESPAEEAKPARAVPPPSLDLKTQLRAVQIAAERGDRDAFNAALADARAAVASYPPGGERNAANDVLSVYGDIERLWDYQFSAPAGAFFDASTDFVSMMRRYPNYPAAIADQTLTVNGQTVYPSAETRQFLATEAARRLDRLGVRTPTRIAEVPPAPAPAPRTKPAAVPQPHAAPPPPITRKPAPRPAVRHAEKPRQTPHHKPAPKTTKPPVKIARAETSKPQPRRTEAAPPAPKPVVAAPAPTFAPAPAPQPKPALQPAPKPVAAAPRLAPAPAPQPAPAPTPTATESTSAPLPTDTMSAAPPPAPETSGTTATTSSQKPESNEPQKSGGSVNLLVAIILIIVGIGVLIFLFRASD